MDVKKELLALADAPNAEFVARLTPVDHRILGARLPALRDLAKRIAREDWKEYVDSWEPEYFEDYMLRGMVIAYARTDIETRLDEYARFVPLIDNWSVCDSFCSTWKPKGEDRERVWEFILPYLDSGEEFQMRFCAVMMLDHFVDEQHIDDILERLDSARNDGYYYKMAAAWAISVCFAKFPERTYDYLMSCTLGDDVRAMIRRKICDSYRVSDEMKRRVRASV